MENDYTIAFRSNPGAFMTGVSDFCKMAASRGGYRDEEEKSLFDRILPWVLGIGGGWLALRGASQWGRYAERTGAPDGPIAGPLRTLFLHAAHPNSDIRWETVDGYNGKRPVFTPKQTGQNGNSGNSGNSGQDRSDKQGQ